MRDFQTREDVEASIKESFEAFSKLWNQWYVSLDKKAVAKKPRYQKILGDAMGDASMASTLVDALGLKDLNFLDGFSEKTQKLLLGAHINKGGLNFQADMESFAEKWKTIFSLEDQVKSAKILVERMMKVFSCMEELMGVGQLMPVSSKEKVKPLAARFQEITHDTFGIGGKTH